MPRMQGGSVWARNLVRCIERQDVEQYELIKGLMTVKEGLWTRLRKAFKRSVM